MSFYATSRLAIAAFCVLAVAHATAAAAGDEAARQNIAAWQGTWQAVSFLEDGKQKPAEELKKITLTVKGTDYHFQNGTVNFSEHGSYTFRAEKNPQELDILVGDGADKGKVYLVIYKVVGDRLTICLQADNKARPREFTGEAGSGCVLEVWERVKP
jgi:uncharacterized protein (TIGR03067 family)